MKIRRQNVCLAIALTTIALCAACASSPPSRIESDYGMSHRLAIYNQISNPAAEDSLAPVEGLDGKIALGIIKGRYRPTMGYDPMMDSSVFDLRPYSSGQAKQLDTIIQNSSQTPQPSTPSSQIKENAVK